MILNHTHKRATDNTKASLLFEILFKKNLNSSLLLDTSNRLVFSSYTPLELLLSQEAPDGAVAGFLTSSSLLIETPHQGGVGRLSPISAVIAARAQSNPYYSCFGQLPLLELFFVRFCTLKTFLRTTNY